MGLLLLPPEILIKILLYLDIPDAYAVQLVNQFFHNLYRTSLQLQYVLECKVAHVHDNPHCDLSIAERLQMLRDREFAWSKLIPTSQKIVPVPSDAGTLYDIERGYYLLGKASSRPGFRVLPGGVQSLPIQKHEESSFRAILIENLVDFCCCIDEHDLIACLTRNLDRNYLLELHIHLFQHSTGNAHPLGAKHTITVCREQLSNFGVRDTISMAMEVFGENLVLTVDVPHNFERMYVYNWKTGAEKCQPISISNIGVIVLHRDLVLLPDNGTWSLCIYYIPPSSVGGSVKPIQRLRLPLLCRDDIRIEWTQCRSAPNPCGDGLFPKHVPSSVPFLDQPETALVFFRWEFAEIELGWSFLSMLVHRHSIMNTLSSSDDWSNVDETRIIDWNDWGPPIAFWSESEELGADITATNGQRYIQLPSEDSDDDDQSGPLVLRDFNMYNVRRYPEKKALHIMGEYTFRSQVFLNPVTSELPFIEIHSPDQYPYSRQSIADGLIIGTKDNDEEDSLEILYFGR